MTRTWMLIALTLAPLACLPEPAPVEQATWSVSGTPTLSIGVVDGPEEYTFGLVAGVRSLSDGRIVVADGQSTTLRVYSPTGDHLSSFGRQGRGPGEFVDITRMGVLSGDVIAVADGLSQRISLFAASGELEGTYRLEPPPPEVAAGGALYQVVGWSPDGQALATSTLSRGLREEDEGSLIRDSLLYYLYARDGSFMRHLRTVPNRPRWGLRTGRGIEFPYVPASAGPIAAIGPGHAVVGNGHVPSAWVFDLGGTAESQVEWVMADATDPEWREHLTSLMIDSAPTPEVRARHRGLLQEAPLPDRLPAARAALIDAQGMVWVEPYRMPWDSIGDWRILDPRGTELGALSLPPQFTPFEIGPDYVLGTWRDELDVTYARRYALTRGG